MKKLTDAQYRKIGITGQQLHAMYRECNIVLRGWYGPWNKLTLKQRAAWNGFAQDLTKKIKQTNARKLAKPVPTPGRAPLPDLSSIYAMSAGHGAPTATLRQINCLVASVCKSCEGTIKEGERCLWVRPNDKKVKSYLIHECCPSSKPSEAKAGGAPMPFTDRLPLPPARKP